MAPGAMVNRRSAALAAAVAAVGLAARLASAHPNCRGDFSPSFTVDAQFCPNDHEDGFCCNAQEESGIQAVYEAAGATGTCADLYLEVMCGTCHPWSGHLFERLDTAMTLTQEFCSQFYGECATQLGLPADYCEVHAGPEGDQYWSYPLVIDDSFSTDGLVKAFPDLSDSSIPDEPVDMRMTPDGSKWWILGLKGQIVEVDVADPTSAKTVLDMSSLILWTFEEGLLSMAFSPAFHTTGVFYASYVNGPSFGTNRLSRFKYDPNSAENTLGSEEVLIISSEKQSNVHSAGWIGFKPSSYGNDAAGAVHELFWAMGDSGPQLDTFDRGQDPNILHGSIIRIGVSSEMESGYSIPSGNPFSGGGGRGEICAQGMRNPYRCSFDRLNDDLYCGDVGHLDVESIKKIECGNNYGWRQFEGDRCMQQIEDQFPETCEFLDRSPFTFPEFNRLYHLFPTTGGGWGSGTIKGDDFFAVSHIAEDNDGELYVVQYQGTIFEMPCGDLCSGDNVNPVFPTPSPSEAPPPTEAPVVLATPSPVPPPTPVPTAVPTAGQTPSPTGAPVTTAPTPAPTLAPFTPVPLEQGDTASPTMAPVPATPSPVAPPTPAPVVPETPAPVLATVAPVLATAAPTEAMTPGPVATAMTPAPLFVRTAAPAGMPEPEDPGTAAPEARLDEDYDYGYDRMPIRTVTEPPMPAAPPSTTELPPVEAVPVTPEGTPSPEAAVPVVPAPATCLGIPSGLGQFCCSLSCGEGCGGVGCSDKPGGKEGCCTHAIEESGILCADTGGEPPCRIPPEDETAPPPSPVVPDAPDAPDGGTEPGTEPLIPAEPLEQPPVSPEDAALCTADLGEDVVPMTGPENDEVSPPEYLGCYIDDNDELSSRILQLAYTASDSMTPMMCEDFCRSAGADIFGLEFGHQCFCGDSRDTDLARYGTTDCHQPCAGDDSVTCGGHLAVDAFFMGGGPKVPMNSDYLGCQADKQGDRALGEGFLWCTGRMTVQICEQFCRRREAAVYGLQYGHECWCGDDMDHDQHGAGMCNYRCSGDSHTTCGGSLAGGRSRFWEPTDPTEMTRGVIKMEEGRLWGNNEQNLEHFFVCNKVLRETWIVSP
ncbi:conserved unknown protein [Ectocarpus siliculosus]|uniref:WSC domain-containing protein n=1 Tax=Ectocarpus siliculosus TaxID=2880 RepID=D7FJN8_ECTSI|nr:conserved unknown protein [Ectocarpus siliculosus]|eukprot:CBJ29140.1 conserved unknown protein [Ectocarpus siliculosus]